MDIRYTIYRMLSEVGISLEAKQDTLDYDFELKNRVVDEYH